MGRLKVDLHPIARDGAAIDAALEQALDEAERRRIPLVEIVHGKGSGQLRKRVDKFLEQPANRARYRRIEHDSKNHGRLFVHFRFK